MLVTPRSDVPFIGILDVMEDYFLCIHFPCFLMSARFDRKSKHQEKDDD